MTPTTLDEALLELLLAELDDPVNRGSIDASELEDIVTHEVLGRLHSILRRARRLGAVHPRGSCIELVNRDRLAGVLHAPEDNVITVPAWGPRRPHLLAGDDLAEVVHLDSVRVRRSQRPHLDPPPSPMAG